MPSELRQLCHEAMQEYAKKLNLKDAKILDVGTAGDPQFPGATSPSEKYQWFGDGNYFRTLDVDPRWKPDFVGDICETDFDNDTWDLIILSNTLEHIYDFRAALREIHRISRKYAIIDCPFYYPYHPEPPSFGDYWRISPEAMQKLLEEAGFEILDLQLKGDIYTVALCKKKE